MKEQQDRPQPQHRSLSPSRSFPAAGTATFSSSEENGNLDGPSRDVVYNFSDKHKVLQLRLQPLSRVQRDLEKYLGSAALEPDQVPTTDNITFPDSDGGIARRNTEFYVSVNSSWKARLLGKEDSKKTADKKHAQGLHDATEILYRCGPDIKQLWTDDVVQQVLTETEAQLKHSSGL
jgi:guanine nucleotide-binding protein subunit alpha